MPAIMLLFCVIAPLYAQRDVNPLEFSYEYPRIGAEFGLSSVWQSGVYYAGCGRFTEGAKINALIAAAYDRPMGSSFRFEALLGFQGRSLSSSYPSRENVPLVTDGAGGDRQVIRVDVDFENIGSASFSYLFLLPSAKFYFTKGLYAGAGINASLLMTKTTQYTKNIVSKTASLGELGLWTVSYSPEESSDPYSKVFPEEEIQDASSIGLDAALYVGAEFAVAKRLKLGPRLLYTIPFTPVLNTPEELKLNTLQFLLGVRYELFN
jgi:hypothetical protein